MLGRIQRTTIRCPMRKGDWWYATRTRARRAVPAHTCVGAPSAPTGATTPSGPDETLLDLNELAGPAVPRLGLATVSRDDGAWPTRPTSPASASTRCTSRIWRAARSRRSVEKVNVGRLGRRQPDALLRDEDEAKRANRLWRHVVGASGADDAAVRGGRRALRLGVARDARRALPAARQREQGFDRGARRRRRRGADAPSRCAWCSRAAPTRVRPRPPRRQLLHPHQRRRPQLPPRHAPMPPRPTWRGEELIAAPTA